MSSLPRDEVQDAPPPVLDWRKHLPVHPAANLFPPISQAELKELAEDIEKNGLSTRVVLWPDGDKKLSLIDGRNRLDALALLGLLTIERGSLALKARPNDHPFEFECAYRNSDPYALALSYNVHRRHLTAEQKRDLIAKLLKAKPEASNVSIAKQVRVDDKTVASVRRDLESNSEIPNKPRVEANGRKARGRKPGSTSKPTLADHPHAAATTEVAPARVNARDTALEEFDGHLLRLIQQTKNVKPQRFLKTAAPTGDLNNLSTFLTELVALKKLATEGDPEASAEAMKLKHAAREQPAMEASQRT
jgi:hypothetical protein